MRRSRSHPLIWVITPEFHRRGGTERSLVEHVTRWRDRFELRIYSAGSDVAGADTRHVLRLPGPQLVRFASWFVANRVIRGVHALLGGRPDAVVSPGVNALDADAVGVHMLFGQHAKARSGDPEGWSKRVHRSLYLRLLASLESRVYSGPATIWSVSGRDARTLESRFERPTGSVPVVPHGVDTENFSADRLEAMRQPARAARGVADRTVALIVGNDIAAKGIDTAIRSLRSLPDSVVLGIAGRVDPDAIATMAALADVSDRVMAWGHVDDMTELFAAADLVVAPSRVDAFNLSVLEAMACGLPVIVSVAAGVSELLSDQRDAVLLQHPDDELELAHAITGVLDDERYAKSLIVAGTERATALTWSDSADRAAEIVEREVATPRVLVLASDAGRTGGIQRVTRTFARAVADRYGGERVGVLSVWRGDHHVPGRVLRRGDELQGEGGVGAKRAAAFVLDAVVAARRWRRRLAIVVTHPHLAPVGWLARLASGAPYAVWCHGIEVWGPLDRATRSAVRRADRVFAPSRFTAEQVERRAGLPAGSVVVMPHCVPPELDRSSDDETKRVPAGVLTVARLHPDHAYKGVDTLLAAWPQVMASLPDATLTVVGDGPDRARLQRRAHDLGISSSVVFGGRLTDEALAEAYATSSLFAMPARHRTGPGAEGEGFGLVFVEAGAAGLPVVAGAGAGADDAVEHDVSGLLVDPLDTGAVAEAIVRVLDDPDLAARLGEGGRRLALTRYSYEAFRASVIELVESMPVVGLVR